MTTQVPVDVVVAAYQDEQGANNALKELETAKKEGLIGIQDAAVLRKDEQSKLHIPETADKGFGRGAMVGGVAGAVVGSYCRPCRLGGPRRRSHRWPGFEAARHRLPRKNACVRWARALTPGTSAIVAVVEHEWVPRGRSAGLRMRRKTS